jgi:hypothetical protein
VKDQHTVGQSDQLPSKYSRDAYFAAAAGLTISTETDVTCTSAELHLRWPAQAHGPTGAKSAPGGRGSTYCDLLGWPWQHIFQPVKEKAPCCWRPAQDVQEVLLGPACQHLEGSHLQAGIHHAHTLTLYANTQRQYFDFSLAWCTG